MINTKHVLLTTILASTVALTGCATNSPLKGNSPQAKEARHNTMMASLKGCGAGAGAGALLGILHGDLSNGVKLAVAGCAVGGVASGIVSYRQQLNDARDLEAQARNEGLAPTLVTTQRQVEASKPPVETLGSFHLPLNAKDVRAHGENTKALLLKAASIANADTSGQTITVHLVGTEKDRAWMKSVVTSVLKKSDAVSESFDTKPSLDLSPVPTIN